MLRVGSAFPLPKRWTNAWRPFVQKFRTAALIGAVVLAAAGLAGASAGELARTHILTVRLPDGSIEQIRYVGDLPPQIHWTQDPAPLFSPGFERMDMNSPFAALDRMSAEMDREAQALLNETARLQAFRLWLPRPPGADRFGPARAGRAQFLRRLDAFRRPHVHPQRRGLRFAQRRPAKDRDADLGRLRRRRSRLPALGEPTARRARPHEARPDRGQRRAWRDPRAGRRERPDRSQVRASEIVKPSQGAP